MMSNMSARYFPFLVGLLRSVGVKEIKGVKRLSGPGMAIQDAPGVMQGGGKWPFRYERLKEGWR